MQEKIYYLDKQTLRDKNILENYIYKDERLNYYWSDDLSCEFYIELAHAGFISVSFRENKKTYLLPEIQFEYSVLEFSNLHIPKKVKKLLNKSNYSFSIDKYFEKSIEKISKFHKDSWIDEEYMKLLFSLRDFYHPKIDFKIFTSEVIDTDTKEIVAAEVGYKIGQTYTSLSGFSSRDKKYNNYGKLQLILLGKYLQKNGCLFWNLGHPYMDYKSELGAKVYKREKFLKYWKNHIDIKS